MNSKERMEESTEKSSKKVEQSYQKSCSVDSCLVNKKGSESYYQIEKYFFQEK